MDEGPNEHELALTTSISEAIGKIREEKRGTNCLTIIRPEKVAKILYLFATGNSQTRIVKKYHMDRETVISVLTDYADFMGEFKQLAGKVSARNYLRLSSIEEDLAQTLHEKLDEGTIDVSFRDLKEVSIAKANAERAALTTRGEATAITEERTIYTDETLAETQRKAQERLAKLKQAEEVVDV
jgi:indole-3-glycerol phosphate synthase